jgi:hypothetical protein
MKEDISDMISSVMTGDTDTAKTQFSTILATKISDLLDSYKQDVASNFFNGVAEQVEDK